MWFLFFRNNLKYVVLIYLYEKIALVRKIQELFMNPSTCKQADLEKILKNQMQIKARPDQPMRACMSAMAKGVTVMMR